LQINGLPIGDWRFGLAIGNSIADWRLPIWIADWDWRLASVFNPPIVNRHSAIPIANLQSANQQSAIANP
jgi:hypothetical protein